MAGQLRSRTQPSFTTTVVLVELHGSGRDIQYRRNLREDLALSQELQPPPAACQFGPANSSGRLIRRCKTSLGDTRCDVGVAGERLADRCGQKPPAGRLVSLALLLGCRSGK
jgi:hypothetical protein